MMKYRVVVATGCGYKLVNDGDDTRSIQHYLETQEHSASGVRSQSCLHNVLAISGKVKAF